MKNYWIEQAEQEMLKNVCVTVNMNDLQMNDPSLASYTRSTIHDIGDGVVFTSSTVTESPVTWTITLTV